MKGFVYVLAAQHGGIKVGCSTDPQRRLISINRNKSINAKIIHTREFADYERAEYLAHSLLSKYCLSREWFSCSPETAIAAVNSIGAAFSRT
jgi:hypothetical protein